MSTIDLSQVRPQFPALTMIEAGRTPVFFDGPGGTQVPQRVIHAMVHYLAYTNANRGGPHKFFGPHAGMVWGREELLERLPAYIEMPAGVGLRRGMRQTELAKWTCSRRTAIQETPWEANRMLRIFRKNLRKGGPTWQKF